MMISLAPMLRPFRLFDLLDSWTLRHPRLFDLLYSATPLTPYTSLTPSTLKKRLLTLKTF